MAPLAHQVMCNTGCRNTAQEHNVTKLWSLQNERKNNNIQGLLHLEKGTPLEIFVALHATLML